MKYKEILYIKQGNRETIIYTTNNIIHISKTIENVFDEWCIDTLSTYKGRLDAIKKKYHLKKQVPIYINTDLMIFPIKNKKDIDNIYINALNILNIDADINGFAVIKFINNELLKIEKEHKIIEKYFLKTMSIYQMIK
jgi:competence protein ComK